MQLAGLYQFAKEKQATIESPTEKEKQHMNEDSPIDTTPVKEASAKKKKSDKCQMLRMFNLQSQDKACSNIRKKANTMTDFEMMKEAAYNEILGFDKEALDWNGIKSSVGNVAQKALGGTKNLGEKALAQGRKYVDNVSGKGVKNTLTDIKKNIHDAARTSGGLSKADANALYENNRKIFDNAVKSRRNARIGTGIAAGGALALGTGAMALRHHKKKKEEEKTASVMLDEMVKEAAAGVSPAIRRAQSEFNRQNAMLYQRAAKGDKSALREYQRKFAAFLRRKGLMR